MSTHDPTNGGARAVEPDPRDKGLGELVKDLASQTSTLVRQEIKLAQAEVTQKGKIAGKGAGMLAGAAVVALLGLGALTAFLIIVLDSFLPLWAGRADRDACCGWRSPPCSRLAGKNAIQKATPPVPQTVETVKEDIQWAKTQTGSAER